MRRTFDSRRIRLACGGALSVLANVLPAHAFAQSTGATDTGDGTEIIVQARRVGESIQDVPASVSVLNADSIARLVIENVADYTRQTPGAILIGIGLLIVTSAVYVLGRNRLQMAGTSLPTASDPG